METIKRCNRCVLDSTVEDNIFDSDGVCKYCHIHDELERSHPVSEFHIPYLQLIISQYFISNKSGIWSLSLIVHSKG